MVCYNSLSFYGLFGCPFTEYNGFSWLRFCVCVCFKAWSMIIKKLWQTHVLEEGQAGALWLTATQSSREKLYSSLIENWDSVEMKILIHSWDRHRHSPASLELLNTGGRWRRGGKRIVGRALPSMYSCMRLSRSWRELSNRERALDNIQMGIKRTFWMIWNEIGKIFACV